MKQSKGWKKALREGAKFKPGQSVIYKEKVAKIGSVFVDDYRLRYAVLVFNGKGDLVFHADEQELTKIEKMKDSQQ